MTNTYLLSGLPLSAYFKEIKFEENRGERIGTQKSILADDERNAPKLIQLPVDSLPASSNSIGFYIFTLVPSLGFFPRSKKK